MPAISRLVQPENFVDYSLPVSHYPVTVVSASGTADVFGDWVELIADVGVSKQLRDVIVTPTHAWQASNQIEIGVGEDGSETAIYRFTFRLYLRSDAGWFQALRIPVGKMLAANARLSARARIDMDGDASFYISVIVV